MQYKENAWSTVNNIIIAIVGALFANVGAVIALAIDSPWNWLWIALAVFCGVASIFFVGLAVRPLRLTLDADGFRLSGGWMRLPRFVAWQELDGPMSCYSIGRGQGVIGYNLVSREDDAVRGEPYGRVRLRPDCTIPDVWNVGGDRVVEELNRCREQAIGLGG
jgi:hypothetical protein